MSRTPEPYTIGTRLYRPVIDPQAMDPYVEMSAYWVFRVVTNLVNLFYTPTNDEVIPMWSEWGERNFRLQPAIEKVALELYQEDPDLASDSSWATAAARPMRPRRWRGR